MLKKALPAAMACRHPRVISDRIRSAEETLPPEDPDTRSQTQTVSSPVPGGSESIKPHCVCPVFHRKSTTEV